MPLPPKVGRYVLLRPLGKGGTSTVHAAVREGDGTLVVLKQLHTELESHEIAKARLRREAELAALLVHKNIARLLDAGWADGRLYLVMEHIPGVTVAQVSRAFLDRGELVPYAVSLTLARRYLQGLEYAHELRGPDGSALGLVHRDLSPSNLMLDEAGQARIIDFGVVRVAHLEGVTLPGTVLGTPRYMAPEQARGEVVHARADLYTLAVVLYELLTAQRLVPKGDRAEILRRVLQDVPPPAHTVNPKLPRALSDVLQVALAKAPKDRFESAEAFRVALEQATGAWAYVSQDRMARFFGRNFGGVSRALEGLRAVARREGARQRPGDVTFELFEMAQAEAQVATRPDVVQPTALDPSAMHAATRTASVEGAEATIEDTPHFEAPLSADPVTVVTAPPMSADDIQIPEATDPAPERPPIQKPAPVPDPAARPLNSLLPPEPTRRSPATLIGAALALPVLLGAAFMLGRAQGQEQVVDFVPSTPVEAPDTPTPVARPAPAPPPAAAPQAPTTPEPTPTKAAAAPTRARSAPTLEVAPPPDALAPVRAQLAALDAAPQDRARFLEVHARLEALAQPLPRAQRERVRVHLSAAERAFDRSELRAALDALARARSRSAD